VTVRVETDTVIYVPAADPGTEGEAGHNLQITFPLSGDGIEIRAGKHGSEVQIEDLRTALDRAEEIKEAIR
jgi:hypothetical protein